jgi:ribose 5-phosphate isomerase
LEFLLACFKSRKRIKAIAGVVEHGLFIGMASQAILAGTDGIEVLSSPS